MIEQQRFIKWHHFEPKHQKQVTTTNSTTDDDDELVAKLRERVSTFVPIHVARNWRAPNQFNFGYVDH